MSAIQIAALVAAYVLAAARLFNAARWSWSWLPVKLQPLLPAFIAMAPTFAAQLGLAKTGLDIADASLLALGSLATAVRGQHPVPTPLLVLAFFGFTQVAACASWKPVARTADGLAEALCAQVFAEQKPGMSLEDAAREFCATEADLKPFIAQVLAAKQAAGKAALQRKHAP